MAIITVPRRDISNFERRYFFEADNPERTNVRKISLADGKTTVNGKTTRTSGVKTEPEDDEPTENDTGSTDTTPDDDSGVAMEPDDEDEGDSGGDNTEEDNPDIEDEGSDTDTDSGDDGDSDVAMEPDDEDEGDSGGDDESDDNDGDNGGDDDKKASDAIRKRALFSRIEAVYEAVDKYTDKLNKMMTNASDNVAIYREACDQFDAIRGYTYDYIIIRFPKASYEESMLFYQRILTAVQLTLEKLSKSLSAAENKDADKEQNSKSKKDAPQVLS